MSDRPHDDPDISDEYDRWTAILATASDLANGIWDSNHDAMTNRIAFDLARSTFVVAASGPYLDPASAESEADRDRLWRNLLRVRDLSRRIFEFEEVTLLDLHAGRFVLDCFTGSVEGNEGHTTLIAARAALGGIMIVQHRLTLMEMDLWDAPGEDVFACAASAYATLAKMGEAEGREPYYVRPKLEFIGPARAARVEKLIRESGGPDVSFTPN